MINFEYAVYNRISSKNTVKQFADVTASILFSHYLVAYSTNTDFTTLPMYITDSNKLLHTFYNDTYTIVLTVWTNTP